MVRIASSSSDVKAAADPLATLAVAYGARLHRYFTRTLDAADAADAVQEVYVRLVRLSAADPPPSFNAAYVFKTADSVLRDLQRRRRARGGARHVELDESLAADRPTAFDELRWRRHADRVRAAVNALPVKQKRILLMHRLEGRSLPDIAADLAIPLRTVQRELTRALAQCRKTLEADGWFDAA